MGFYCGLVSIAFWIIAQVPQLVTNYRRKSADALSAVFVAEWLLGDTSNLVGALLQGDQPQTVVLTAQYFICMDVILMLQWVYYTGQARRRERIMLARRRRHHHHHRHRRHDHRRHHDQHPDERLLQLGEDVEAAPPVSSSNHPLDLRSRTSVERGKDRKKLKSSDGDEIPSESEAREKSPRKASIGIGPIVALLTFSTFTVLVWMPRLDLATEKKRSMLSSTTLSMDDGHWVARLSWTRRLLLSSSSQEEFDTNLVESSNNANNLLASDPSLFSDHQRRIFNYFSASLKSRVGTFVGYLSSVLYLNSRMAQIYRNWQRKSAEGLAISMFFCAISANFFYGMALMLRSQSWNEMLSSLPWLIGSMGTMTLDFTILMQAWWLYPCSAHGSREKPSERRPSDEEQPLLLDS